MQRPDRAVLSFSLIYYLLYYPIHSSCPASLSGPGGDQPASPAEWREGAATQGDLRPPAGQRASLLGEDGGQRPQPHREEQGEGGADSDHQP